MSSSTQYRPSSFFNFTRDSYLERTSRPVYALVFLLPFIVFYEMGTLLINTDVLRQSQVRVVAFVWLQEAMEHIGLTGKFAWMLPALAVVIMLISLQIASRTSWKVNFSDFFVMAVECVLFAIPLIILSLLLNSIAVQPRQDTTAIRPDNFSRSTVCYVESQPVHQSSTQSDEVPSARVPDTVSNSRSFFADIVTGIGAGIYEELVFRLILILLLIILLQDVFRLGREHSIILAVLVSAALFSAHHHIIIVDGQIGQGAAFNWAEFGFRTIAGVYFATLFAVRGFGITAGSHAFYDILATILNAAFYHGY